MPGKKTSAKVWANVHTVPAGLMHVSILVVKACCANRQKRSHISLLRRTWHLSVSRCANCVALLFPFLFLGAKAQAYAVVEGYRQNAFRSDRHSAWRQVCWLLRAPLSYIFLVCHALLMIHRLVEASQPDTARLWVAYSSGLEAPLEPQLSAGQLSELG